MKKEQQRLYQKYLNSTARSVLDVYKSPSIAKIRGEMCIKEDMLDLGGYDYKVTGHNCNYFSCAFVYEIIDGETGEVFEHLRYYTGMNIYDFEIE